MFKCSSKINLKCSWCKKRSKDTKKIKYYCKYYNKNICEECYNKHYLKYSKVKFEDRSDLFL